MLRPPIFRFPAVLAVMMIGGLVLSLVLPNLGMAARRVVLFEESTNWGCPPCYVANPAIHQFLEDYSVAQVVAVKWHVWWPDPSDPYYNANRIPVDTRIAYYQISAAPDVVVDGANGPQPGDYGGMSTWVENRLAIASPIAITATGVLNGLNYDVAVSVNVEQVPPAGDYRLYVVLSEHHIPQISPNGETDHYDVFRHSNANSGEVINLTATGVQNFNRSLGPVDVEAPAELQAVVWVQNHATKEVLNANSTWPKPTYYLRVAGGQAGVLNDPNTVANLTRDVANLGTQSDVYDIAVSTGFTGNLPAGWSFEYTTSQGTFTGPSTLPLASGAGETITVEIDSHGIPGGGLVELTFTSQADPSVTRTRRFSKVSNPTVIVYDDDGGPAYENYLIQGLDASGISWGLWDDAWGKLSGAQLSTADAVFWGTGLSYPTLDPSDRTAITAFLNAGGKGFFNGQEIGWELCTGGSGNYDLAWYQNNLHANFLTDAAGSSLTGIAGDPIGNGLSYLIDAPGGNQPYPDGISPRTGAVTSVQYNATYKGIIRWDSGTGSQLVYMAHGIEGILNATTARTIVERVIDWFNLPASTGVPTPDLVPGVVALAPNFPNPFTPQTSIPYSLREEGRVRLTIYDVEGRLVRELVRQVQPAGRQVAFWDGRDATGRSLGSGIYYYRLETPGFEATRSMVLVK